MGKPEPGRTTIIKWHKCIRSVALHEGRIIGCTAQIPHEFKYSRKSGQKGVEHIGWAVTLVPDTSDNEAGKQAGRGLPARCESSPRRQLSGARMVRPAESPYIRRGHAVPRDCSEMFGLFLRPVKAPKYSGRSWAYAPGINVANCLYRAPKNAGSGQVEKTKESDPNPGGRWNELMSGQHELYGDLDNLW